MAFDYGYFSRSAPFFDRPTSYCGMPIPEHVVHVEEVWNTSTNPYTRTLRWRTKSGGRHELDLPHIDDDELEILRVAMRLSE